MGLDETKVFIYENDTMKSYHREKKTFIQPSSHM